jgi:hypothetical protein
MTRTGHKATLAALALALLSAMIFTPAHQIQAADHSEAPTADEDRPNDIGDIYVFLDPNDNSKVVIAFTVVGFIVPSENVNQGAFDPHSRYRIEFETTGDAKADTFLDITFSERTSRTSAQIATVTLPGGGTITAPTTVPTQDATAPTRVVTENAASGAAFFAGVVDDPFFFDIPAFNRFTASVVAGNADTSLLNRMRDSFAGYNTLGVAISLPKSLFANADSATIGVDLLTQRQKNRKFNPKQGIFKYSGAFANVDRMGIPAVNTVLIPFARKDEYNFASTQDDAAGRFAPDIIATLTALGTNEENINILAGVAVLRGDFLRLNLNTANTGDGGGNNAGAGFPNGRRLSDDVIAALLTFVANQTPLDDGVTANDVPLTNTFPFFAISQQPRDAGTIDDNTRN